jgi:hypothetical protein
MWALLQLYQQFKGFLPQTHIDILELRLLVEESNPSATSTESVSYHKELMTEEEEKLIDDMLRKRMTNYSDINVVTEQLSKELVVLETVRQSHSGRVLVLTNPNSSQENIHDLIAITERVKQMNGLLKNSSKQLSNVDAHLEEYQDQLDVRHSTQVCMGVFDVLTLFVQTISVYIEQIEKKNNTMDLITRNQKALLQEIEDIMVFTSTGAFSLIVLLIMSCRPRCSSMKPPLRHCAAEILQWARVSTVRCVPRPNSIK